MHFDREIYVRGATYPPLNPMLVGACRGKIHRGDSRADSLLPPLIGAVAQEKRRRKVLFSFLSSVVRKYYSSEKKSAFASAGFQTPCGVFQPFENLAVERSSLNSRRRRDFYSQLELRISQLNMLRAGQIDVLTIRVGYNLFNMKDLFFFSSTFHRELNIPKT